MSNVKSKDKAKTTQESLNELQGLAEESLEVLYCALNSAENISRQNSLISVAHRLAGEMVREVEEAHESLCYEQAAVHQHSWPT
jgi:hypothetical protein